MLVVDTYSINTSNLPDELDYLPRQNLADLHLLLVGGWHKHGRYAVARPDRQCSLSGCWALILKRGNDLGGDQPHIDFDWIIE